MGVFQFKQFQIDDSHSAMKIGTDGVLLGAWADAGVACTVIDIGTGTGLIALMMAQRFGHVDIIGVDMDSGACVDAMENVRNSPWHDRIKILKMDVIDWNPHDFIKRPLCIVSNPPYFTEPLHSPLQSRALARHGDSLSVESLIKWSSEFMIDSEDRLSFIIPSVRRDEVEYLLSLHRLTPKRITDVITRGDGKVERCLFEVMREDAAEEMLFRDMLQIRSHDGQYSDCYKQLTRDFYIRL